MSLVDKLKEQARQRTSTRGQQFLEVPTTSALIVDGSAEMQFSDASRGVPDSAKLLVSDNVDVNVNSITDMIGRGKVFETNFLRQTYYVHKSLIEAIDSLARTGGKGMKTKLINQALQEYVEKTLKR